MDKLAVFGLGNMGGALVRGLVKGNFHNHLSLEIFDTHEDRALSLANELSVKKIKNVSEFSIDGGVLLLAVKPHDINRLGDQLKGKIGPSTLIVSILAGTTIESICQVFDHEGPVVRAMPNIAATVGAAATAMCENDKCSNENKLLAKDIFSCVGEAYWTKEALLDTVTGLSGSGPAYIFMVIEALTDGGVKMGLPRDLASGLAVQTVLGAALLVKETQLHPAVLKDQVSTPAGTTISALHELEAHGLRNMFVSAVQIATERSMFLGKKDKK